MRRRQPEERLPRAHAHHERRPHQPAHPQAQTRSYFPEDLVVRYSRVDTAVIAAVSEMVTSGVSTRKVKRVAHAMGIDRMEHDIRTYQMSRSALMVRADVEC